MMDEGDFEHLMQECINASSSLFSSPVPPFFLTVLELMISKEIRDFDFSALARQLYGKLIRAHFYSDLSDAKEDLSVLYPFIYWSLLIEFPEINSEDLSSDVDQNAVTIVFDALTGRIPCLKPLQRFYLKWITWIYAHNTTSRSKLRTCVGKALTSVAYHYNPRVDATGLLGLLTKIIEGMQVPIQTNVCDHICNGILVPLHVQNGMTAWRDQEPILKTYHNALVCCEIVLIEKDLASLSSSSSRIPVSCSLILEILKIWPDKFDTNTPKEIILLHEIEKLLEYCRPAVDFDYIFDPLFRRLQKALNHENFAPLEKALQMFKNHKFCTLLKSKSPKVIELLLPILYREGNLHWNPTVNKMTATVLNELKRWDCDMFEKVAINMFTTPVSQQMIDTAVHKWRRDASSSNSSKQINAMPPPTSSTMIASTTPSLAPRPIPPVPGRSGTRPPIPTSVMTTMPRQGVPSMAAVRKADKSNPPPVTITGVAPWKKLPQSQSSQMTGTVADRHNDSLEIPSMKRSSNASETGLAKILEYIQACQPKDTVPLINWQDQQAASVPTLLPNLRFHDLVFGRELGMGAFSVVKYARHVTAGATQSQWPEYAIKVIDVHKIKELEYMESVDREITILSQLQHPGIARMVSSFKYTGSAYLVLEYAALGDLHSYLMDYGAIIDFKKVQFVIGEIVAAILYIHDLGFVFNDLKPENVLITEIGHMKLTDFGACRPYNDSGKERLRKSRLGLMKLRSGHWRDEDGTTIDTSKSGGDKERVKAHECTEVNMKVAESVNGDYLDARVEGTPGYMPLEALDPSAASLCYSWRQGQQCTDDMTSLAVDAWALGCLVTFCRRGRPPFYGDKESVIQQIKQKYGIQFDDNDQSRHHVWFDENEVDNPDSDNDSSNDVTLTAHLNKLTASLLSLDPSERPTFSQLAVHPFLKYDGSCSDDGKTDMKYSLEPLKFHSQVAISLPRDMKRSAHEDKEWGRRQFSHIWAPTPQDFNRDNSRPEVKISPHNDARIDAILKLAGNLCSSNSSSTTSKPGNMTINVSSIHESDFEKDRRFQ